MSPSSTLIDSVVLEGSSRDSLFLTARVMDADGVASVSLITSLDAQGSGETIPMVLAGDSNRYRSWTRLDLSRVSATALEAEVGTTIRVVDGHGDDTLYTNFRFRPNQVPVIDLASAKIDGRDHAELVVDIANTGNEATGTVDVGAWVKVGQNWERVASKTIDPLIAKPVVYGVGTEDTPLRNRVARGTTAAAVIPVHTAEVRLTLPDSLIDGKVRFVTVRGATHLLDGRSVTDSIAIRVPESWGVYAADRVTPLVVPTTTGRAQVRLAPGSLPAATLVSIEDEPLPTVDGQAEIAPLGTLGARMRWGNPVESAGAGVDLTINVPKNLASVRSAVSRGALRIGRYDDDRQLWEVAGATLAADTTAATATVVREGLYALVGLRRYHATDDRGDGGRSEFRQPGLREHLDAIQRGHRGRERNRGARGRDPCLAQ